MVETSNHSRRGFLGFLSITAAATATPVVNSLAAKPAEADEPKLHFEHPAEYLAAMQTIGWRPVAMYQRMEGGGVHCMGVAEYGPDKESIQRTWKKFHAIQMRCHISPPPVEVHPYQDWWRQTWQYLYDSSLHEDVTPPKLAARLDAQLS